MNQRSVYSTLIQQKGESLYGEGRKQGTEGEVKQTGDIKPTHHSRIMAVVMPTDLEIRKMAKKDIAIPLPTQEFMSVDSTSQKLN